MKTSRPNQRAWRFVHPRFVRPDELDAPSGIRLHPLGGVEMADGDDAIRQAILMLLSTDPGERVMRPEYGCRLNRLLFSPNDDTTAGMAIHLVRQALARWEPRIDVLRVDAGASAAEPGRLDIAIEYRVRSSHRTGMVAFSLPLNDEQN